MGAESTTTVVPPSPGKLPGITVSDAFGLPDNWTLAESLKGEQAKGTKIEVEAEKGEGTPDPDEMEKQKAEEKAAAEQKTIDDDKAAADAAAAAKAPAAAKPGEKPAPTTTPKPGEKPAPVAAAKPGAKPAATPTPAPAAAPAKIKIGDKEYTEEELKKRLEAPVAPVPAATAKPAAEAKKEPTAEEKAAEDAKLAKVESEWIAGASQALKPSAVDEASMEKILNGGKEAVAEFDRIRREDMARTVLAVRKDLDQLYKPFFEAVNQMQQGQMTREDERMWNEFTTAHPALSPYETLVKQHAASLVEADPESVSKMSEKDFNAKVAELTIGYIRQFNPKFGEVEEGAPAAAPAPGAAPAPAAVSAAAKTLAAAKPAARVTPKPPAGSLPAGAPAGGGGRGGSADFQKSAVASLM